MDRPAADDRMAVLEIKELPGRASMRDCALVLGSGCCCCCWGTLDDDREVVRVVNAGSARGATEGRRRVVAPAIIYISEYSFVYIYNQSQLVPLVMIAGGPEGGRRGGGRKECEMNKKSRGKRRKEKKNLPKAVLAKREAMARLLKYGAIWG